ncbi:hypothetical protein FRB99_008935, partial [Tulasnella sp. 403]
MVPLASRLVDGDSTVTLVLRNARNVQPGTRAVEETPKPLLLAAPAHTKTRLVLADLPVNHARVGPSTTPQERGPAASAVPDFTAMRPAQRSARRAQLGLLEGHTPPPVQRVMANAGPTRSTAFLEPTPVIKLGPIHPEPPHVLPSKAMPFQIHHQSTNAVLSPAAKVSSAAATTPAGAVSHASIPALIPSIVADASMWTVSQMRSRAWT